MEAGSSCGIIPRSRIFKIEFQADGVYRAGYLEGLVALTGFPSARPFA